MGVYIIEYVNKHGEEKTCRRRENKVDKTVQELEDHGATVVTWYDAEDRE